MLKIGTRGSALALAQARTVAEQIPDSELVVIESSGSPLEDKARWTRALDEALLSGEVDIAIHSAKDVPADRPDGVVPVAVPKRVDPRDSICGAASLTELAEGATVGTASPRRAALLKAIRPDLEVVELRGNVDTRLRKLEEGACDAIILAAAGLERLGLSERGNPLDPEEFTPAPGQGCLLLEALASNERASAAASPVDHQDSATALKAERALVIALDADCHTAVGAMARVSEGEIDMTAVVLAPDGSSALGAMVTSTEAAETVGRNLAKQLLDSGADRLLALARGES
jgi:hydroxymethylbilane synthase